MEGLCKCVICQGWFSPYFGTIRSTGLYLTKLSGDLDTAPNVFICELDYQWLQKLTRNDGGTNKMAQYDSSDKRITLSHQQRHSALDNRHLQQKQEIIERKNDVIDNLYRLLVQERARVVELEEDKHVMKAELDYWRAKEWK